MPPEKPAAASSSGSAAAGTQAEASTKNSVALVAMPQTATRSWRVARTATKPPQKMPLAPPSR
ncbi:hypothetical protein D3C83_28030 [compost metagenome]